MKTSDEGEKLAGGGGLSLSTVIFFLRQTPTKGERAELVTTGYNTGSDACLFSDDETGLTLGWTDLTAAVAAQISYGGAVVPVTLAEALDAAIEYRVGFLVRTPDGDIEYQPVSRSSSRLH